MRAVACGIFLSALAGLAGQAWLAPALAQSAPAGREPFRIGVLYTMTGNGASYGRDTMIGTALAAKELNAQGGILGRPVVLVQSDDQADPTIGVTEAKRLAYQEKVNGIVGPFFSTVAQAIAPTLNDAHVMYVGEAGSQVLTPQAVPTYFSLQLSAEDQGAVQADYAKLVGAKSIATIGDTGTIARTVNKGASDRARALGIAVVANAEHNFGDTDMTPQVLTLRRANPDLLLINSASDADVGHILQNVYDLGWQVAVASGTSIGSHYNQLAAHLPAEVMAQIKAGVDLKAFTYCTGDPVGQSDYSKLLQRLHEFDPQNGPKASPQNMIWGYDSVMVLKQVTEGAGSADGKLMTAWLEQNAGKVQLVEGTLTASPQSHFLGSSATYVAVDDLGHPRADGLRHRAGC